MQRQAKARSVWRAPYSGAFGSGSLNAKKSAGIRRSPNASRGSWPRLQLLQLAGLFAALAIPMSGHAETIESDICIYGGTVAGIAAGVQGARMGKSVVIAEPGNHPGGMTS